MSQESPSSNQGSAPPEEEDESREGNETNLGRLPSLSRPYQPITTAHQEVVDEVDKRLHNFIYDEYEAGEKGEDVGPAPIAITGAYGSGKTQLEYHIFRRAWEEGVPAVYIGAPSEMLSELACCTFKISSPDGGLLPIDESLNEEGRNSVQFLERKSSSAAWFSAIGYNIYINWAAWEWCLSGGDRDFRTGAYSAQIKRLGERISPDLPLRLAVSDAATNATAEGTTCVSTLSSLRARTRSRAVLDELL